jgi:hypothetical protein
MKLLIALSLASTLILSEATGKPKEVKTEDKTEECDSASTDTIPSDFLIPLC